MSSRILRRAPIGWNEDDFDVLENGKIIGRIFFLDAVGPQGRPWMWASGHNGDIKRAAHGYEATREAAMAAFAKSWRKEIRPFWQTPMGISGRLRGCLMGADTNQPEVSTCGPWPGRSGHHRRGAAGDCR
jgi:hypothetical protein